MNIRAIILGGVTAFALSMTLGLLAGFLLPFLPPGAAEVLVVAVTWISLAAGGAAAARQAGQRHALHGLLAGMVCLNLALPINIALGVYPALNVPVVLAAIVNNCLVGAAGGYLAGRRRPQ